MMYFRVFFFFFLVIGWLFPHPSFALTNDELWQQHRIITHQSLHYGDSPKGPQQGRIWVPEQITSGAHPVVLYLHGAYGSTILGPGSGFQLDVHTKKAIDAGTLQPPIIIAPFHGDHGNRELIWTNHGFTLDDIIGKASRLIAERLPNVSIDTSRIVLIGHSNAAGRLDSAFHKIVKDSSGLYATISADGTTSVLNARIMKNNGAPYIMGMSARNYVDEANARIWLNVFGTTHVDVEPCPALYAACKKATGTNAYFFRSEQRDEDGHNGTVKMFFEHHLALILPANGTSSAGTVRTPLNANEIAGLLRSPSPQIDIPGLDFSDVGRNNVLSYNGAYYLFFDFLGEYIAAVYRYAVGIVSILAIVMIMLSGLLWATSAGNSDRVTAAKRRLAQAVVGLLVAVSSYLILYAINPELVSFRGLLLQYIPEEEYNIAEIEENESTSNIDISSFDSKITKPTWNAQSFDCMGLPLGSSVAAFEEKKAAILEKQPEAGVMPLSEMAQPYNCNGDLGGFARTIPEMIDPLCNAARIAKSKGYKLIIGSSYRDYETQVRLWCTSSHRDPGRIAVPGSSNHGIGRAVDVILEERGTGNRVSCIDNPNDQSSKVLCTSTQAQCYVPEKYIEILGEIFKEAHPLFNRLETEIWHFEFASRKRGAIGKFTEYPKGCSKVWTKAGNQGKPTP